MGYPAASAVMVTGCPGANPSTVVPKTICDCIVSLICIRGSAEGFVESSSNTRPSSALEDALAGKLTVIWPQRGATAARTPARSKQDLRSIYPAYTTSVKKLRLLKWVRGRKNRRSLHYAPSELLWRHVVVASCAKWEIRVRSVEKHFQERTPGPQISPLRSFGAPVEMTKGRAVLPLSVVAEQNPFFINLSGRRPMIPLVGMTILLHRKRSARDTHPTRIVIPTGAKRSGETCGSFGQYSHDFRACSNPCTLQPRKTTPEPLGQYVLRY